MENEKKNGAPQSEGQSHKKNRPPKRRGYFIEPAKGDGPHPQINDASQRPEGDNGKKQDGESRPKGNRPPRQNRGERPEASQNDAQRQVRPEGAGNEPRQEREGGKSGKNRRNHNRRGGKQGEQTEKQGAAQQNPPKKDSKEPTEKNRASSLKTEDKNASAKSKQGNRRRSADKLPQNVKEKPPISQLNESEYEEVRFPAPDLREPSEPLVIQNAEEKEKEEPNVPMVEVVGIRFKSTGKVYYFSPGNKKVRRGEAAIVETARGQEYGEVSMGNTMVKESDTVPPLRPILRVATDADKLHHKENKKKEDEAFRICNEKIMAHGLDMKLIDAQYTFDNSKLLFYFTSSGRVDFRDLVKDLASVFRTRIELRQIGIRDEAKLMGGVGMCGRPLCCTLFLSDFGQVSIKMAKEQNLSLNSAKISGICGRLMCCLRYEHETYEYEIKRTPPVDSLVRTADGNGIVTEMNPLVGTVKVRLLASPETPPKAYKREDVVMLQKKKPDKTEKNDKTDKSDRPGNKK